MELQPVFVGYIFLWTTLCLIALFAMWRARRQIELFFIPYWRMLTQPWKLITFLISTSGMIIVAPYTLDPTWDYVDAGFMSILTYATAPWAVATIYLTLCRRRSLVMAYIAAIVWLFSVSWSYDIYLVWRDGYYPATWLPNIFASSILYASAGLFWSLENVAGRGIIFGFIDQRWPSLNPGEINFRLIAAAIPFMLLVGASVIYFLI